jgi:hypothetical protein
MTFAPFTLVESEGARNLRGGIAGAIVEQDDLTRRRLLRKQRGEAVMNAAFLIPCRNQNGDWQRGGDPYST